MDPVKETQNLVKNLNQRIGPSPYDIAWMARLRGPSNGGSPRWPEFIDWLLENQHPDGSWGSTIPYYHDRVICTLVAAIALRENGNGQFADRAAKRAERYLWRHMHLLYRDPFELVGFELLLPTLLDEARSLALDIPRHAGGYEKVQSTKLRLIPPEMLYSPYATTIHSLEFLGLSVDTKRLEQALSSEGSLGNSPATTAYYLLLCPQDTRAWAYMDAVYKHHRYPGILHPFRLFELIWVLNNLDFSGVPVTEFAGPDIWQTLQAELHAQGIGLDPTFLIPDGDNTAVCSRLLIEAGYDVDPMILAQFEDKEKGIFRTYDYERNASVGTNVHALETLRVMTDYPHRQKVRDQIVIMLLDKRVFNTYWVDKWHASPYYGTSHVLVGLLREGEYLVSACRHTIDWLLHNQHEDGSWGSFKHGTVEETAYVMSALLHYHRYAPLDVDVLHRGADYLMREHRGPASTYPALWIDKCLYEPRDIIRSAVLAALILYQETFGKGSLS